MPYRVLVDNLAILILFGENVDFRLIAGRAIGQLWNSRCLTAGRERAWHTAPVAILERVDYICDKLGLVGRISVEPWNLPEMTDPTPFFTNDL